MYEFSKTGLSPSGVTPFPLNIISFVFPETVDETPGEKLHFKEFMQGVYEPKPFQPVWGEGKIFVHL